MCWLLLYAFRDLWKEWGDSNFQIFSQNCQFRHRRLESLEHFNVLFIYHYEQDVLIFRGCHIILQGVGVGDYLNNGAEKVSQVQSLSPILCCTGSRTFRMHPSGASVALVAHSSTCDVASTYLTVVFCSR